MGDVLPEINIRTVDDWIAVYKNGYKVWENHSCGIREGLDALCIPFVDENFDLDDSDPDSHFPETI